MNVPAFGPLILFLFLCVQAAVASTGLIKASSNDKCPTSAGASVYKRSDPLSKVLGAIPDGTTVSVDLSAQTHNFYWVQGNGFGGRVAGYVYKQCVTITGVPIDSVELLANPADCSKIFSGGCNSFNDMFKHQDREVMKAVSEHTDAFVCFKSGEDAFVIVYYDNPFKTAKTARKSIGHVAFDRYKDGQKDASEYWVGVWSKPRHGEPDDASFSSSAGSRARVTPTEIHLTYRFHNVSGSITTYTLNIRQSTLRFTERYDAMVKKSPYDDEAEGTCYKPTGQ